MNELITIEDSFCYRQPLHFLEEKCFLLGCPINIPVHVRYWLQIQNPLDLEHIRLSRKNYMCMKFIIDHDLFTLYQEFSALSQRLINKEEYSEFSEVLNDDWVQCLDTIHEVDEITGCTSFYVYQEFFRKARVKVQRVADRIDSFRKYCVGNKKLYFCTITLDSNKFLDKFGQPLVLTSGFVTEAVYDSIRLKLRKHIANYSNRYVFNKDFGLKDTKRLHFHGVALFSSGEIASLTRSTRNKFGSICSFKLIDEHSDYIARYLDKLSFHALKVNYGKFRENLIYSRELPYFTLNHEFGAILGSSGMFARGEALKKGSLLPFMLHHGNNYSNLIQIL